MAPTLDVGDRIVVDKLTYRFRGPQRFEIVVFRAPSGLSSEFKQLVKRVIGVPGDVVAPDGRGGITVNGRPLVERYLSPGTPTEDLVRTVVPADSYLVLGDNRTQSVDGRFFGTVGRDEVIGRAVLRVWPVGRFGRP
jgi:signal peptidase I